jgi:hypothetical protein
VFSLCFSHLLLLVVVWIGPACDHAALLLLLMMLLLLSLLLFVLLGVVYHSIICLCGCQDVLVMDYIPGERLIDGIRSQFRKFAASQGRTLEELEAEEKEKVRRGIAMQCRVGGVPQRLHTTPCHCGSSEH